MTEPKKASDIVIYPPGTVFTYKLTVEAKQWVFNQVLNSNFNMTTPEFWEMVDKIEKYLLS
jgi:hypothetical protein